MHEKIIEEINRIRNKKGISTEKLAEITGISYSYLKSILEGNRRKISLGIIAKIAEAFGIDPKELIIK